MSEIIIKVPASKGGAENEAKIKMALQQMVDKIDVKLLNAIGESCAQVQDIEKFNKGLKGKLRFAGIYKGKD
ncbi:MAG: hypothetical protein EP332_06370 [Bacteroidetes bacterium]|nr:MAG: hypothetical protein EP332_06370 [Bacteroidota bacterium]